MRIALLATLCLLAACQSGRHIDHTGEDAATLVFSSDGLPAQPVICVPGKGLQETPLSVGLGGYKALEDLNEAMKKSSEVHARVATGSAVTAGFRYTRRDRFHRDRCLGLIRFDAVAGATYQLRLEKSPECGITATRLDGENPVEQETREGTTTCD